MSAQWVSMADVLKDVTEAEVVALDAYRPRPVMSTYRLRRATGPMSEKFLEGIPEKLTRSERNAYRKGEWFTAEGHANG